MAQLWVQDEAGAWGAIALDPAISAPVGAPGLACGVRVPPLALGGAVLLRSRSAVDETWLLQSAPGDAVTVNSSPLYLGLRALRDRDEIRIAGGHRFYFSTERLAHIEPFPQIDHAVICARCKQAIQPGSPAVQCPQCGTWCHQSSELGCWTYGQNCPLCDQPTALDAGYRWSPGAL